MATWIATVGKNPFHDEVLYPINLVNELVGLKQKHILSNDFDWDKD